MKKLITILFSLLVLAVSGQNYKELIKNAPGKDKFPNASALNVFTKIDVRLNRDNSFSKHVYYIKKILTYKGKTKYSDVKITYNANFEKIDLGDCFAVRDNEKIPLPKEAYHDNQTYMSMYSPEYINQRQTVVNMPAIEPGDFIVMDYTVTSKPRAFFSGIEQFQEENPYLHKELTITAPASKKLTYQFPNGKVLFSKTEKGDSTIYSWEANNVPLIKDEINKPSYLIIGRPVFYSSDASWSEAAPKLFKQFNSVNYQTEAVKQLMPELTNSTKSNETKLQLIYNFIEKNFVFKYSMNDDRFVPQPADKMLKQQYGSDKELLALFLAMAKEAGVEGVQPVFVLSQTHVKEAREIPCRNFISGMGAYYKGTLLSFFVKDLPYGFALFEKAWLLTDDQPVKIINYQFNTKNYVAKQVDITLKDDFSATADFTKALRGMNDFKIRRQFKDETEKNRKIWFTSQINDKSISVTQGPEFVGIQNPEAVLTIKFKARIDDFYTKQDNYLYMQLPETEKVTLRLTGKGRENPYQISQSIRSTEHYTFDNIPKGYKLIKPKKPIIYSFKTGDEEMSFSVKATLKKGKLAVERIVYIPATIVSTADYPQFYQFISSIQKPLNTVVFLKR